MNLVVIVTGCNQSLYLWSASLTQTLAKVPKKAKLAAAFQAQASSLADFQIPDDLNVVYATILELAQYPSSSEQVDTISLRGLRPAAANAAKSGTGIRKAVGSSSFVGSF
ncbi:hypothetical protein BYT27DRAFT_7191613 [Phlegmacium glaucopus]|nr:hypothetical protein BYT27DRAFT_7191613 [Phlegmacium glaucopus]